MNKDPKKPTTTTSWGGVAEWYDDLLEQNPDSYQKNVLMPKLIRIVNPQKGMNILDLACGQGYFSRAFAQNGAAVIGYDISKELIEKALSYKGTVEVTNTHSVVSKDSADIGRDPIPATKQHRSAGSLQFHVSSADSVPFVHNESIDVVTVILALQNIENIAAVFGEVSRVLKPGGKLIFVVNHPSFRIPQRSDWGWDEQKSAQYRRLDAYMSDAKIEIDMTPGEKDSWKKKYTVSFHRPLQVFFKHLNKSNLAVTRLEEWISHKKSQNGPRGAEEDRMRKEIPMFLCIEATKI